MLQIMVGTQSCLFSYIFFYTSETNNSRIGNKNLQKNKIKNDRNIFYKEIKKILSLMRAALSYK